MQTPTFWKLSLGTDYFDFSQLIESIEERIVYVHKDTGAKGTRYVTQGEDFINAKIGDYFYLTHGNSGIYLLGQFIGPANFITKRGEGWTDRPFRIIARSNNTSCYDGSEKWWTPNHRSTFVKIPEPEIKEFEELILKPYFEISLSDYGFQV